MGQPTYAFIAWDLHDGPPPAPVTERFGPGVEPAFHHRRTRFAVGYEVDRYTVFVRMMLSDPLDLNDVRFVRTVLDSAAGRGACAAWFHMFDPATADAVIERDVLVPLLASDPILPRTADVELIWVRRPPEDDTWRRFRGGSAWASDWWAGALPPAD